MFSRDELLAAANATPVGGTLPMRFSGAAVDSRLVQPGQLFVALRGSHTDGHRFIAAAISAGATAILCSDPGDASSHWKVPYLVVQDPLSVLQQLAQAHLARQPRTTVIGITGSVGKTSTKDAVASLVSHLAPTLKTPASFNTETGLPLTLLELEPEQRYAVLEMGAQWVGEIAMLCRIAPPKIGIVTAVGAAHLEYFGSIDAVERAKSELIRALPDDGLAVLNDDDRRVRRMARKTHARVVTFGRRTGADVRALRISGDPLQGLRFTLAYGDKQARVHLNIPGQHAIYTALAAAAVSLNLGMPIEAVAAGLAELRVPKRRGEIRGAYNGSILIDDSYNANRQSVEAALQMVQGARLPRGARRWVVLGDMFELGLYAAEEHTAVGATAAKIADMLVGVGAEAKYIVEAARASGMSADCVHYFAADVNDPVDLARARDAAAALIREQVRSGDLVLVKGSLGMGMDAIVSQLAVQPASGTHLAMSRVPAAPERTPASATVQRDLIRYPRR